MADPLALARWQWEQYKRVGKPLPPPPGPGKIRMESVMQRGGRPVKKKPARSGEPWTDAERVTIVKAFLAGTNLEDIALDAERSATAVTAELKRIGFPEDQF